MPSKVAYSMDGVWMVYGYCIIWLIDIGIKMSKTIRVIIYPKDIVAITGKSYQSAWSLLKKIRLYYHKQPHQVVTVFEFCQ
ncbi:MAG: hypothetical protein IPO92_15670 [Saprospiraceae bacterium]|nr:hypothetical protein [Saprospiraceae bacterium]